MYCIFYINVLSYKIRSILFTELVAVIIVQLCMQTQVRIAKPVGLACVFLPTVASE